MGSALLEASNKLGELRITTSVRSNSVMSVIYPVNDSTDTRLIKGRYLLTRIRQPNAQDLVTTPFTATCRSCHSQPHAIAHFKSNGGQLFVQRNAVVPGGEACVTCHGTTGPNALWNVHRFSVVAD
ncbi:MAG: multiheme c-type cytochrome [Desulfuromonadaceae bacterium]